MSNQTQCPNCGGYKVHEKLIKIDPKTGKSPELLKSRESLGCGFAFLMVLLYFFLLMVLSKLYDMIFSGSSVILGLIVLALPFLVIIPLYINQNANLNQAKERAYDQFNQAEKRADKYFNFFCDLCGYKWEWREGTPLPKVKVQPDLIAAGSKRLEQEAKARQERWEREVAAMQCKACGNRILEGQSHCAFCGASR
jgi:hypothetical protein